jgi:predicted small lipoprotein YifL
MRTLLLCLAVTLSACGTSAPLVVNPDAGAPVDVAMDAAPACPVGDARCGERCVDLSADPAHCGACGRACEAGQVCTAGACRAQCREGALRVRVGRGTPEQEKMPRTARDQPAGNFEANTPETARDEITGCGTHLPRRRRRDSGGSQSDKSFTPSRFAAHYHFVIGTSADDLRGQR